jgi:hypothetical protein
MPKKVNFLILIVCVLILQIGVFAQRHHHRSAPQYHPFPHIPYLPYDKQPISLPVPSIPSIDGTTTNVAYDVLKNQYNYSIPVIAVT